jgi:hypothetical protein
MANLDTVGVKYEGDISDLQKDLNKLEQENLEVAKSAENVGKAYTNVGKQAGGIINTLIKKEADLLAARNRSNNPVAITRFNKLIAETRAELDKATGSAKKLTQQTETLKKSGGQLAGIFQKAGVAMVAAFGVQQVIAFGKKILEVSANFERMEAVLTNTLGSKGAAQAAMSEIVEFATKTPFQVAELTDSFVKLSNQGFIPTQEEMRKLGDLAASQGKGFDQLTEAIIDAQTGEFERLKEFGIRASKEGNNVTFAFKGVETQTQFTAEAMREYILSLGDVEGVSGGMAAISATLGGKFSNMEDAVMALQRSLGDELNPVMIQLIDAFIDVLDNIDVLAAPLQEVGGLFSELFSSISELVTELFGLNAEGIETRDVLQILSVGVRVAQIPLKLLIGTLQLAVDAFRLIVNEAKKAANFFGADFEIDLGLSPEKLAEDVKKIADAFNVAKNPDLAAGKEEQKKAEVEAQEELNKVREEKALEGAKRQAEKEAALKKKEAEKQAELMLKMAFQAQEIRIQLMDEGIAKEIARRNLAYEKEKQALKGNKAALLLLEKKYLQDLEKLQEDELDKELERQLASQENQRDFTQKYEKMQEEELDAEIERQLAGIEKDKEFSEVRKANEEKAAQDRIVIEEATFATLQSLGNALIKDQSQRAKFQKALALFQIGINTAEAIAKGVNAAQSVPFPANLVAIATTVAAVAANIANAVAIVNSSNTPAYATGVIDLQGPGTETSDSIHARLSKGESVMTASETRNWKSELRAIRDDNFEDLVYQKYVLPALKEDRAQRESQGSAAALLAGLRLHGQFDDSRIVGTMERNKPASSKDIQRLEKNLGNAMRDAAYLNSKMWKN